jgi:hypothetical protein
MAQQVDELTPIADYIVREMTHNPWTPPARQIRELNSTEESCNAQWAKAPWWLRYVTANAKDCADIGVTAFFIACNIWYNQVKTNGPWDHKPILKRRKDPLVEDHRKRRMAHIRRDCLQLRCLVEHALRIRRIGDRFLGLSAS